MNIFGLFEKRVADALGRLAEAGKIPSGLDVSRVVVEPPRDPSHGDLATNAAMVLAKEARMNPRALAELLAADLQDDPRVTKVEIAGPGFINITLAPAVLHEVLRAVVVDSDGLRPERAGRGRCPSTSNTSRPIPTGPMHVGHGRGAVFGDALAGLLDFAGYEVTREYYINDAGAQVDVLARSAYPALPGGAGRGDRRDPGGPLSGRLPEARRRARWPRSTARACSTSRRPNGCRSCARPPSTP